MSIRLVSSARNLREQFKGNGGTNLTASGGISIYTSASGGISNVKTLDPSSPSPSLLSRQGSFLRRSKSQHKKKLIPKVFADDNNNNGHHDGTLDLSMEMTLVIVKRCIKEIRLATKGILRQVQMAQSQKVIMDTIRLILDDDAGTELSVLRQIDIHLIAHAMKWAIRYSEETLVTYGDYQALFLDQDRSFSRFVHDLPPTNRAILLDLFSLCADVTLLRHLNDMSLVAVAKAISLSIMAEPEREFTTFDASLQQRNMWGAACEDLLRAFLVIKTTHDLAKIEHEDEVDENRYVDNITRVVKSARQRSNENGVMPNVSVPTSASSTGWPTAMTPSGYGHPSNGYFDQVPTPRSASPFSQQSGSVNGSSSLSRSHSLAKSTSSRSRPISPAPFGDEVVEYEQMMQDHTHLVRLRHTNRHSRSLRPAEMDRRKSSAGLEGLYMLPVHDSNDAMDGYESEPDISHPSIIPDFADGLGWDFSKIADLQQAGDPPSLTHTKSTDKGVNRSNSSSSSSSSSSIGSSSSKEGHLLPSRVREMSKQSTNRLRQLQEQHLSDYPSTLQRAASHQDMSSSYRDSDGVSPPQASIQRSATNFGKVFVADNSSPSTSPQKANRNSVLRRSVSLDPHAMQTRLQKKSNDLRHDALIRDLAIQEGFSPSSAFSLESSPQDLERPAIPTRSASQGMGRSMSKNMPLGAKLEISVGNNLPSGTSELTPISNPPSNSSLNSPRPQLPLPDIPQSTRTFEVVSRPKDIEVNVLFTPITPISPKAEMRSKFQESFSDRPMSPPPGYVNGQNSNNFHSRSPTSGSSRSQTGASPSSSKMSSSPKRSEGQPRAPVQQGTTFSGISTSSPNPPEGKSKAAGFIRALSHKLRSKQSDDQLRPVRINNQVVGSTAVPPSVSIQAPRLELNFLGDPAAGTSGAKVSHPEDELPPMSAPASFALNGMALSGSGPGPIENWRKLAQDSLPVPTPGSGELGPSSQAFSPPVGFMAGRRASGTLFGAGNVTHREQRRRSKNFIVGTSSMSRSPLNQLQSAKSDGNANSRPIRPSRLRKERGSSSDSSYTTDEDSVKPHSVSGPIPQPKPQPQATLSEPTPSLSSSQATANSPTSPQKTPGAGREYRFSTATLLKDGKLYYQLQWDSFSELGFKSDFFHEPEQYLSGLHQKRVSRMAPPSRAPSSPANQSSAVPSNPPPGQPLPLGQTSQESQQSQEGRRSQDGPSPEQRLAAMKAARESFMALVKDPKALAALKAGSTGGIGQATIIGTGSFPIGSTQPVLHQAIPTPLSPTSLKQNTAPSSALAARVSQRTLGNIPENPYPSPAQSPHGSSTTLTQQSHQKTPSLSSSVQDANASLQKSMSGASSHSSQGPLSERSRDMGPSSGNTAAGAGGAVLSSSLPTRPAKETITTDSPVPPSTPMKAKKNRLFGSKFKSSSKKNHRTSMSLNTNTNNIYNYNTNINNKSESGKKKVPMGVVRQDLMTKTEESLDEVFPWMTVEHMTGRESGWVMLEPVKDGAVGWVKIDKLEEEMAKFADVEKRRP
ncbi:hypothetical protein BG006_005188 [Podila minutissima]|uniref:Rho-GAP domain-containing protein n=1 Tax=Podila minutissima TaxID=64525 RepID=A0A9P5SPB7_9FUNG|nr:hypothetical protein BG006_005188 [Podila minutissima]